MLGGRWFLSVLKVTNSTQLAPKKLLDLADSM